MDAPREPGSALYLKKLRLENFMGFHGVHDFEFMEGLNVVYGPLDSGKTSLCRALEFVFFGAAWGLPGIDVSNLVNVQYQEETWESGYHDCGVDVTFVVCGDVYRIERSFHVSGEREHTEDIHCSSGIPLKLSEAMFHELIHHEGGILYSDEVSPGSDALSGDRLIKYLNHKIQRNIEGEIGFIVLDDLLSRLSLGSRTKLLTILLDSGLEQTIFIERPVHTGDFLPSYKPRTFHMDEKISSITLAVHDFPFPPETLRDNLEHRLQGRYLFAGEVFHRKIYEHKYQIKVCDIDRSGCRFEVDHTEMLLQ